MAALPETLKSITATKIEELKKQRNIFEKAKAGITKAAGNQKALVSKVDLVHEGTARLEGVRESDSSDDEFVATSTTEARIRNQRQLLRQAHADPSFSQSIVRQIGEDLSRDLELHSLKHEHAQFFSELVTEWLSNPDDQQQKKDVSAEETADESSYESLGRKEMHEQRAQWEELVFSKSEIDAQAVTKYLEGLFSSSKTVKIQLETLRKSVRNFGTNLEVETDVLDVTSLKMTIKGLLGTDLLSDEKSAILKTFSNNKDVLKEVADVLNMRLRSLDTWSWATVNGGISLEMRKQLNGKYRVFMDEDILDALLLHIIGMKWAVQFKLCLTTFFRSHAWTTNLKSIPKADRDRRDYFLGADRTESRNVVLMRKDRYSQDYFMTQLPVNESEGTRAYDGGDSDDDDDAGARKSPLEIKHSLLHLLITESLVARHLHPERVHTIIRSDFKWFGPSLPHTSIYAVLEFFGMSDYWLGFFRRFLEAPLRFVQDGPGSQIQVRQRGVPMSHALSDVFGEVLLFVMDFAVNQATEGSYLYRLHDDFWFWGQEELCKRAWKAMTVFANTVGIEFNEEKTGTARLSGDSNTPSAAKGHSRAKSKPEVVSDTSEPGARARRFSLGSSANISLPQGEVRWGFLRLDTSSNRFVVDQSMVDDHIKELKIQLSGCNSVFSYIQAYNAYLARFFSNNFGKPSYAFGREHVDMMISTFARIQKALFERQGSVTDHLRELIESRFDVHELPDGFFYWPIHMGGLELRNPFVPLFAMRASLRRTPERMLQKALEKDEAAYNDAKASFQRGQGGSANVGSRFNYDLHSKIQEAGEDFMSKEEYLKYQEERSAHFANVYELLLTVPAEHHLDATPEISAWLENLSDVPGGARRKGAGILKDFSSMQAYWKWVLATHGSEIVKRYGSVRIADEGMVPIGVVGIMKAGKVKWRG